jgi:hypothetical protein
VHSAHQFSAFQSEQRSEWCIQCTIPIIHLMISVWIGAYDAPIFRVLAPDTCKMVHHMHHSI